MSIIGTVHEDATTDVLGVIGSWQWMVTFVAMAFTIPIIMNQFENAYFLRPPHGIECDLPSTDKVLNSSLCSYIIKTNSTEYKRCDKWRLKLFWLIWMKKKWLVFCDQKTNMLSTTMICRLGLIFGCLILGIVSDSFGRKQSIKMCIFADLLFRVILVFCNTESWFHLLIFLRSLFASANSYMGLVLVSEIASNGWRTKLNAIASAPRLLAAVSVVHIANIGPNFETYNCLACIFDASLLILLRWLPESPQWLLYNRKIPTAEKLLFKAAKTNGIELGSNFKIRPVNQRAYMSLDESWTFIEILSTPNICILTLTAITFWCLYYFLWTALYIRVHGSAETYVFLKVLSFTVLMVFINICLTKKLKLRKLLVLNITFLGCINMMLIIIRRLEIKDTISGLVSTLALATGVIVHALILNITPRLFAINVRGTLFGCCHSAGHLGAIICYLVVVLYGVKDITVNITEIILTIVLTSFCYLLPDVDGRELPDIMEDMDYFSDLSKPLRWVSQKTNSPSYEEIEMRVYSFGSAGFNLSTYSQTESREPARRIGFSRLRDLVLEFYNSLWQKISGSR